METPKVCVIMPVYNGEQTIEMALRSLVAQTYPNWECVIVNDGSADRTKDILDSLTDPRFRVFHLPQNKGRGYARQYALEQAEGDLLTYLDADDFYHNQKLEIQVQMFRNNPELDLIATEVLVFGEALKAVGKRIKQCSSPIRFHFGDKLPISMPTAMLRLERAQQIAYNTGLDASEDVDYFSKYLDGGIYQHIPYPYYYYYVTISSTPYRKVLHYTVNELKRGLTMFGRANLAAMRVTCKAAFKWCVYAILIPFIGEKFFLEQRNVAVSETDVQEFKRQVSLINSILL